MQKKTEISIVIAIYNEEKNIRLLHRKIKEVMNKLKKEYEIIFIDDGSTDGSFSVLKEIYDQDKKTKIIKFRKNFGQTLVWQSGIDYSKGDLIITMDGDLQNDPEDIPKLLKKLEEGYDVVSGWRQNRKDSLFKKLFSIIANFMRRAILEDETHDAGCSLKVYRRETLQEIKLYGEMHRFITSLIKLKGFRIGEVKVKHHKRRFEKTKYNTKRLMKGFLDLLFIKFWGDYSTRPLHFFGFLGLIQYLIAFLIFIEQVIKAFLIKKLTAGPLLILIVLLIITGTLFIIFGFLGEIMIRIYYERTNKKNYSIEKILE